MLLVALAAILLSGCGSSSSAPSSSPSTTGRVSGRAYNRADICKTSQYVGNRKSHVLHRPGDRNLPSTKNQVCFSTLTEARAAGYHLSRH